MAIEGPRVESVGARWNDRLAALCSDGFDKGKASVTAWRPSRPQRLHGAATSKTRAGDGVTLPYSIPILAVTPGCHRDLRIRTMQPTQDAALNQRFIPTHVGNQLCSLNVIVGFSIIRNGYCSPSPVATLLVEAQNCRPADRLAIIEKVP